MASPFPGMDPYLEDPAHWPDFHHRLISALSEAIADVLPGNYFARIDERVILIDPDLPKERTFRPDVVVAREPGASGESGASGGGVATVELSPETIPNIQHLDPHTEAFIEIFHLPDRELVTSFELMSPVNKDGGRGAYLEKRQAMMDHSVNIVELDLLLGGRRLQLVRKLPPGHYYFFVSRADRRPMCDVYAWTVRDRLPVVPVPLRSPDPDIKVNLAEVFRTTYERGRYGRMIDYARPAPVTRLDPEDAKWATETARTAAS